MGMQRTGTNPDVRQGRLPGSRQGWLGAEEQTRVSQVKARWKSVYAEGLGPERRK